VEFRPEEHNREAVAAAFRAHRRGIEMLVPIATVRHIGSTAVTGALTKGDLDLLVSVPARELEAATAALRGRYAVNQPENWSTTFASLREEPAGEVPVGVQVVVAGSDDERLFIEWPERLVADANLLAEYNALKRRQQGADPDDYIAAKGEFIEIRLGVRGRD
jgi:GrpB-like predicted nucleotidyltransferase (UPF0157 family)